VRGAQSPPVSGRAPIRVAARERAHGSRLLGHIIRT
jgi:hypothetical protein